MNLENRSSATEKVYDHDRASGLKYSLRYTRWLLTVLGIWPYVASDPTKIEKYVSKLSFPLGVILLIIILPIPTSLHIIVQDLNFLDSLMLIAPVIYQVFNIVKYLLICVRSGLIKVCINHIEDDWRRIENHTDRNIMIDNLKVGNDFTTMCMICMYGSAVTLTIPFAVISLYSGKNGDELNKTVRRLPYPGLDRFLDFKSAIHYEIAFLSFSIAAFFLCTIVITVCNLIAIFVTHACGQIQIVTSRIEKLIRADENINDSVAIKHRIKFIIEFHVRVLRFSSIVEKVMHEMCLLEVGASVILMCIYEYTLIAYWRDNNPIDAITYFVFCITLSLNIYIFCSFGELLTEKCQHIGKTTYMIDWYKLPGTSGLSLILIIGMTNCPRTLTAGGVIDLSICSWGNILKTSFTYLNLLVTITES